MTRTTPTTATTEPADTTTTTGWLVAFEGIDGVGKSTQLDLAASWARSRGLDPLVTREPTDGAWGRRIRAMALSGDRVDPDQELRWFVEDRGEHVARQIAPALAAGRLVLCDRYFLSTVAYQGARGLDWRELLADQESRFPLPDLALVFTLDATRALERVSERGAPDQPAFEEHRFLERVASVYAELDCPYVARIEAQASPEQVACQVAARLAALLDRADS